MIIIDVLEPFREFITDQTLKIAAGKTLQAGGEGDSPSLTIRITNQDEIRDLNLQYRGLDKTTDVLSFPTDFKDPDLDSRYLGDVVISYPQAASQARNRKHAVEIELQLLVVHGVLHLLGQDHASPQGKQQMWSLQERILQDLGLEIELGED